MPKEKKKKEQKQSIEKFVIKTVSRSTIQEALYNPRKINEGARKKLKTEIEKYGLVQPACVWNKRTGNIVGGHQRLSIMDSYYRNKEYSLVISEIDVDEKTEIILNTLLNNTSTQGEFDTEKLLELKVENPEIDFIQDMGFDKFDLDYMFSQTGLVDNVHEIFKETELEKKIKYSGESLKEASARMKAKHKKNVTENDDSELGDSDYLLTIVFISEKEKSEFMAKIKRPLVDKYIRIDDLLALLKTT